MRINELYICFSLSLAIHAGLFWAGAFDFRNFREKPFEAEFILPEEVLPDQYEITEEKEIVETPQPEEAAEELVQDEDELRKSLLRYQDSVKQKIQKEKRYPRWALRLGREGRARVFFVLRPSGDIEDIRLARSSGVKDLDIEAIDAVKRAGPFAPFPLGCESDEMEFEIEIIFKVNRERH